MRRITHILMAAAVCCGCWWTDGGGGGAVIKPVVALPAGSHPAAPTPAPAEPGAPAATVPTTVPYRIVEPPQIVAATMLQVNDKFITLQQVLHPIRQRLMAAARAGEEAFRVRAPAIIHAETGRQVRRTLVLGEAKQRLDENDKKLVEEKLESAYRQVVVELGGGKTAVVEWLRQEGTTLAAWRKDMRQDLTVQLYLQRKLRPRVSVNRKMMWEYYQAEGKQFRREAKVQMQIIAAPFSAFVNAELPIGLTVRQAQRQEAKKLIDQAAAALAGGEDFGEAAKRLSRGPMASGGGVWPLMEKGSFRAAAVEKTAFDQGTGRASGVIETAEGFYIVKTLDRQPGEQVPFEQVQGEIDAELRGRLYDKIRSEYMLKLFERATIQGAEKFEQAALEAAARRFRQR